MLTEASGDADTQNHELKPRAKTRLEPAKTELLAESAQIDKTPSPTLFWSLQREYGVAKEQAQGIVAESGQDWSPAVNRLKSLIPAFQKRAGANGA